MNHPPLSDQSILKKMQQREIEDNWHLVTPSIMTLVDDEVLTLKIKGCEYMRCLFDRASPQLLERSGLNNVFMEALMPFLLYLPPLTPEEESVQLLRSVYPTLKAMARASGSEVSSPKARRRLLSKIMRAGIINGLQQAGEYPQVAEFLLTALSNFVKDLGIWSVSFLRVCDTPGIPSLPTRGANDDAGHYPDPE